MKSAWRELVQLLASSHHKLDTVFSCWVMEEFVTVCLFVVSNRWNWLNQCGTWQVKGWPSFCYDWWLWRYTRLHLHLNSPELTPHWLIWSLLCGVFNALNSRLSVEKKNVWNLNWIWILNLKTESVQSWSVKATVLHVLESSLLWRTVFEAIGA